MIQVIIGMAKSGLLRGARRLLAATVLAVVRVTDHACSELKHAEWPCNIVKGLDGWDSGSRVY